MISNPLAKILSKSRANGDSKEIEELKKKLAAAEARSRDFGKSRPLLTADSVVPKPPLDRHAEKASRATSSRIRSAGGQVQRSYWVNKR